MAILSIMISFILGFLVAVGIWFFMSKWGMENTSKNLKKKQIGDKEAITKTMAMTNEEIMKDASLTDEQRGMILFTRSQRPQQFEGREVK
ncbi:hypothetical protein HY498_05140 [Candidatus Woesearchaeota archaeon]|nr:hypothetical protein [Candidatus Woesearchaeota archaeon]